MDVTERFRRLTGEWARHCQRVAFSSNTNDRLDCEAYRGLVALGPTAVPLVMGRLGAGEDLPWEFVLQEVTGIRMIADPDAFDPEEARREWVRWWAREQARGGPGGSHPPSAAPPDTREDPGPWWAVPLDPAG
jgi:hypothetical protein